MLVANPGRGKALRRALALVGAPRREASVIQLTALTCKTRARAKDRADLANGA